MLYGPARRPAPEMGFSISGLIKAPFTAVTDITGDVLGAAGTIGKQAVGAVGQIGGAAGSALAMTTAGLGPALQALRPPAAGLAPPPASKLPIYLGAGAAGIVLLLLLTAPKKRPTTPAPQVIGP